MIFDCFLLMIYKPYANMADHSVVTQDELHVSKAGWCFVLPMLPQESLASLTIWSVVF